MTMEIIGFNAYGDISVRIDGADAVVPDDTSNRHRREIAEWEGAGNTIPPYVAPPKSLTYSIPKSLPWLRMTDAEATTVSNAMAAQGARFRMIYDSAVDLNTADPLFPTLKAFLSAALTPARATELLAEQ